MKFKLVLLILLTSATIGASDAMGQWVQTNGPYGGAVVALAVKGSNLFAATTAFPYEHGIFLSSDSGANWIACNKGLPSAYISALATSGPVLLAGTDSGVFLTTNNGQNWVPSMNGIGNSPVLNLISNGPWVVAETGDGLYLTTNRGASWNNRSSGLPALGSGSFTISGTTLLVGTQKNGIFRSTDSGLTWSPVYQFGGFAFGLIDGIIFTFGSDSEDNPRVFRSTNDGLTWVATGVSDFIYSFGTLGTVLFAAPADENNLYISTDSGQSWSVHNVPYSNPSNLYSLGSLLFVGNEWDGTGPSTNGGGVYSSTDSGKNWNFTSTDMPDSYIFSLLTSGNDLFAGTPAGVAHSIDNGTTWSSPNNGLDGRSFYSLEVFDSVLYGGSQDTLYKSTDNGLSFSPVNNILEPSEFGFAVLDSSLFVETDYGVYRRMANGASWILSDSGLPQNSININILANIVAMGGNLFLTSYENGVFLSTDTGTSWIPVDQGLPSLNVGNIASAGNNLFVIAATNYYSSNDLVYCSTDNGMTWVEASNGLPNNPWGYFAVSGKNLFVASDSAIELSTNNGESWHSVRDNLDLLNISAITTNDSDVLIGTWYNGIWRRPLSEMTGSSSVAEAPQQANTITIYPNPVSHEATIGFSTNISSSTNVTIFDVLGNSVAALFSGTLEAGNHSLTWDANTVPPGTYYARIENGNGDIQTVKVVKN